MHETWKSAFDQIHAEQGLKEQTKEYLSEKVYRTHAKRAVHFRRLAAAAVFCLLLCFAGGGYLFFTPVTFISVDVNPSLELGLNRFRRIVSIEGYNDDGRELAESLNIRFLDYREAINRILENDTIESCLSENGVLSLTVAGEYETQSDEVLQDVEDSVSDYTNVHCHSGSMDEMHEAHSCGMSFGKYQAFQILQSLDPSVTSDEAQNMTMREIWDLIRQYSDSDGSGSDSGAGASSGGDDSGAGASSGGDDCSTSASSGGDDCSAGASSGGNDSSAGSPSGGSNSGNAQKDNGQIRGESYCDDENGQGTPADDTDHDTGHNGAYRSQNRQHGQEEEHHD